MRISIFAFLLGLVLMASAQTRALRMNPGVTLPKDTTEATALLAAMEEFLAAAQKPGAENPVVYERERLETQLLLDEMQGLEKSLKFQDDFFYRPYLTNVVPLQENEYLVQISYIGIKDGQSFLRASLECRAHRQGRAFAFSSPLLSNTRHWKTARAGNLVFHYQDVIERKKVNTYNRLVRNIDRKLKLSGRLTEYYCADNLVELQRLVGIDYKSDYNGRRSGIWSSTLGNRQVVVLGNRNASFSTFDPHDLFHDRLSLVIARSKVNKPVDEGCAYLYGGSWGLSWREIFQAFREQVASDRNVRWTEVKESPVYFQTKEFKNSADYIVNALLVKKIEKEKGFDGVWELLNVGPFEKGNEKYYQTLEKLTGISKANYDQRVWELIRRERAR